MTHLEAELKHSEHANNSLKDTVASMQSEMEQLRSSHNVSAFEDDGFTG